MSFFCFKGESRAELQGNSASNKSPSPILLIFLTLLLIWQAGGASIASKDEDRDKNSDHKGYHNSSSNERQES